LYLKRPVHITADPVEPNGLETEQIEFSGSHNETGQGRRRFYDLDMQGEEIQRILQNALRRFISFAGIIKTMNCILRTVHPIYRTDVTLPSKCCILYIFSTNISTEYFKHAAHSPFFLFKMPFIS
jgi:hypothetical protein